MTVLQRLRVPDAVRDVLPPDIDYVDAFTLMGCASGTPEQWARVLFEDVAGRAGQFVWRGLLGLRLRDVPGAVAGWAVAGRGDGWVRLEARSWMVTGHLVVHVQGDQVSLVTALGYRRRVGRWVWKALAGTHRGEAPGLLRDANAIISAR